jgi:hypothetical protein
MASVACGSSTAPNVGDPDPAAGSSEGELRTTKAARELEKTVAVEMDVTPRPSEDDDTIKATVALPDTVKKIIAFKRTTRQATSTAACSGHSANLRFLDESGKQIAKAQLVCGVGVLDLPDTATIGIETDVDLLKIARADRVPADALWGITEVRILHVGDRHKKNVTDAADVAKLVATIKGDQKIDRNASVPRCLPDVSVDFERGSREVASATFFCGADGSESSAKATFRITAENPNDMPIIHGVVRLDPRPFERIFPLGEP